MLQVCLLWGSRMKVWIIFQWGAGFAEGGRPGGSYDVSRLIGFVANFGYTYDNRFLLDFSFKK